MEINVRQGAIQDSTADLVVVNVFEGVTHPAGATGAVDQGLGGSIRDLIAAGDVTGKEGQLTLLYTRGEIPAHRVLVVGLGERESFGAETLRRVSATVVRYVQRLGVTRFDTVLHGAGAGGLDPELAAQALVEGAILGAYAYRGYKTGADPGKRVETLRIVEYVAGSVPAIQRGAGVGRVVATAACLARDLANEPGNQLTPTDLAELAEAQAEEVGLTCDVLGEEDLEALGMGAMLGVARGSDEPAQLIILEHNADADADEGLQTVVVVGKGITFDSGGISLKSHEGMERMKYDMSGAAVALATARAVAELDLPVHLVCLIPATENLPGGRAYKPGDVLTSMSGRTIEVISTDAEGRLILADALAYARPLQPAAVVDLATLTGGCIVALGHLASALMGTEDALLEQIESAAERSGERVWRLPLWPEYEKQIESDVADCKNSGGREASTIIGGTFLKGFAQGYPWAHLDIAGTAWAEKEKGYLAKGATGWGVRLLVEWLRRRCGA